MYLWTLYGYVQETVVNSNNIFSSSLFAEADLAVAAANRITTPYMTKYERARVLGTRALQIRYVG